MHDHILKRAYLLWFPPGTTSNGAARVEGELAVPGLAAVGILVMAGLQIHYGVCHTGKCE